MTAKEIANGSWRAPIIAKDGVTVAKEIEPETAPRPNKAPLELPEDEIVRGVD